MSEQAEPPGEESFDIDLRSPRTVAERLVVLGAVLTRIGLEMNAPLGGDDEDIEDAEEERFDLLAWLRDAGLFEAVSRNESRLLQAPLTTLDFELVAESSWQAERLAALAWAAGLLDRLPPLNRQADVSSVLAVLPSPWDDVAAFVDRVELRLADEIAIELERCDVWLWRAEAETARRVASRADLPEIAQTIAEVVTESVEMGLVERASDGDFLVDGASFHRLSEEQRAVIETVAAERLRALNWLRGAEDEWDDLSTDL